MIMPPCYCHAADAAAAELLPPSCCCRRYAAMLFFHAHFHAIAASRCHADAMPLPDAGAIDAALMPR